MRHSGPPLQIIFITHCFKFILAFRKRNISLVLNISILKSHVQRRIYSFQRKFVVFSYIKEKFCFYRVFVIGKSMQISPFISNNIFQKSVPPPPTPKRGQSLPFFCTNNAIKKIFQYILLHFKKKKKKKRKKIVQIFLCSVQV